MFHAVMQAAIEGGRSLAQMDELSRQLWQGHGAGTLRDEEAQALAERLHGRRSAIQAGIRPLARTLSAHLLPIPDLVIQSLVPTRVKLYPPRRVPVSPDRRASRDRRRLLACSGPMPPRLATRFTESQRAVLRVVADAVAAQKTCDLCIDAIAARAGVSRRLVQVAIRLAEGDGLLTVEERRHKGRRNASNLVNIVNDEWRSWIERGRRGARAAKKTEVTKAETITTPCVGEARCLAKTQRTGQTLGQAGKQDLAQKQNRGPVLPAALIIGCKPLHPTDTCLYKQEKIEAGTALENLPKNALPEDPQRIDGAIPPQTGAEPKAKTGSE